MNRQTKLNRIIDELKVFYHMKKDYLAHGNEWMRKMTPFITRFQLRQLISRATGCISNITIYNYINWLLAQCIIEPNPTSAKSSKLHVTLPTNDTRYTINKTQLYIHTSSQQSTLLQGSNSFKKQ